MRVKAGLYEAKRSRHTMSANDTLSCCHYAVWLARKHNIPLSGKTLLIIVCIESISM